MKRALKWILSLFLVLVLLLGAAWFFLRYQPEITTGWLTSWADHALESGRYSSAIRYYTWAYRLSDRDPALAVTLADAYKASGNYTKAEYTLANAIAAGGQPPVYEALCQTYVEQDKLLDAVSMLDQVADPAIKAQLDAQRPAVPTLQRRTRLLQPIYERHLIRSGEPLCEHRRWVPLHCLPPIRIPFPLSWAKPPFGLWPGENGLVSPLAIFGYTISGVVEPVELTDPALDACVREILGRGADSPLTTADLWGVETLTVPSEASNLEDLQHFTGLTTLVIQGQASLNLSFLSQMTELTTLDLSGKDRLGPGPASSLGDSGKLTSLNLSGCGLSTLSGLESLTTLTSLDLSNNSVSDLSPLAGCKGLTTPEPSAQCHRQLCPLANLADLTNLDLSYNALADFTPVATCVALQSLNVSNNVLPNLFCLSPAAAARALFGGGLLQPAD